MFQSLWIEILVVVVVFGFILVCVVWIRVSDFKRSLIMQIEARNTRDKILEDILAEEKIRDEMVDLMIHKILKQRLYM